MEEINEAEVSLLLLGFCSLSKAEQSLFVDGLNGFLFVSPGKRRQLIERWKRISKAENAKSMLRLREDA